MTTLTTTLGLLPLALGLGDGAEVRTPMAVTVIGGLIVSTVLTLSPTMLAHRATFSPDGYWRQWGGVFGRTDRAGPRFRWTSFAERVRKEEARISDLRRK